MPIRPYLGLICIVLFAILPPSPAMRASQNMAYTFDEVLSAIESGQFRVIQTDGSSFSLSPEGQYIAASGDGIYRLSDGTRLDLFQGVPVRFIGAYGHLQSNNAVYRLSDGEEAFRLGEWLLSPNGEYLASEGTGVFRLRDGEKLFDIPIPPEHYSDGIIYTFGTRFSPQGNHIVLERDGVYRLSDQQKIFDFDEPGWAVSFSLDEQYVIDASVGVIRLSDLQLILPIQGLWGFSPNATYAYGISGVYRLRDGQRMGALDTLFATYPGNVSPNEEYVSHAQQGIYEVATGRQLFSFAKPTPTPRPDGIPNYATGTGVYFSPDSQYAIFDNTLYRLQDQQMMFSYEGDSVRFSDDSRFLWVHKSNWAGIADGLYRIADGQQLFGGDAVISPDWQYAALPEDGVYQISDGQRLFTITESRLTFLDERHLLAISENDTAIYWISDGYRYGNLQGIKDSSFRYMANGIVIVGSAILIIDPSQSGQQFPSS